MPLQSVWRSTVAMLGLDTSATSALSALGVGSEAAGGAGGANGPGTRFSRLAYRVTVGGVEYTASASSPEAVYSTPPTVTR